MSREAPPPPAGRAGEVVAIGAGEQLVVLGLAGARTVPAEDDEQVRAAWRALPAGVAVVVLTEAAACAVGTKNARNAVSSGRDIQVSFIPIPRQAQRYAFLSSFPWQRPHQANGTGIDRGHADTRFRLRGC